MIYSKKNRLILVIFQVVCFAVLSFFTIGFLFVSSANASHLAGGFMSATIDASGIVTVTAETIWRKGDPNSTFPVSGITRSGIIAGIEVRFDILDGTSRAVVASSTTNPALAIDILGTTVSVDQSNPNFDVRRQEFVVDLPALGLGQGTYILYWNDIARINGINNADNASGAKAFSLECRIIFDGTPRATPTITNRIATTVTKGEPYSENLNGTGTAPLSYSFIVGSSAPRYGPDTNIPGITVDATGQVEISGSNTAQLNEDNLAGQPAGDYVFKVQITDPDGQYIEQDVLLDVVMTSVVIDIKPGSDPNSINCQNTKGTVPVAILTENGFNATTVDPSTVTFGPNQAQEMHGTGHIEDVDGDADQDMVFHFRIGDTGIQSDDTQATLKGQTFGGTLFEGTDAIEIVPKLLVCDLDEPGEHDYNQVRLLVVADGRIGRDANRDGHFFFPIGTCDQYVFAAGPMIGGLVNGTAIVAEATFSSEFVPSEIGTTGEPFRVFNSTFSKDKQNWPPEFSDSKGKPIIVSGAQNLVVQYNDVNGTPIRDVTSPLGIEIRQRSLAYKDAKKRNAIIFIWEITNVSSNNIDDAYFAFWADHDIGVDGFTDDRGSIVNDMAIIWDDDFSEATFSEQPAIMGFDFLETPGNTGVASFSLIGAAISGGDLSDDATQYDVLSGGTAFEVGGVVGDIRFLISTGPFDLQVGGSAVVAGAILFGKAPDGTTSLAVNPSSLRPDPNDPILAELLEVQENVQQFYDQNLKGTGLPKVAESAGSIESKTIPKEFALFQNSPNPFNPETEIRFVLPKSSHVVLRIYNTLGQEIRTLLDSEYSAGSHNVGWDGKDNHSRPVASGIYLYKLQAGGFSQVRKMSLIR